MLTPDEVANHALNLDESARLRLAERLLMSLDAPSAEQACQQAWRNEAQARLAEVESGQSTLLNGPATLAHMRQNFL